MQSTSLADLLAEIDSAIDEGIFVRALRLLLSNLAGLPDNAILRERIAGVLASVGREKDAVGIWELVARHYANAGFPARSLAATKQLLALRPDSTALLDHFAALYNIKSPYIDRDSTPPSLADPVDPLDLSGREPQLGEAELLDLATERASDPSGLATQPGTLPPLTLLSLLPADALRRVAGLLAYEVFAESQRLVAAGARTPDLLWTVSDDFTVQSESLYRLPAGTLIGLNSFGRSATPSRSTVLSRPGSEVLRLTANAVQALDEEFGDFRNRLATLRRHALTEGLLERHDMFSQIAPDQRLALMDAFTGLRVSAEEILVAQDHPSPGLFLILEGTVEIVRDDQGWQITIGTLEAGDVFGEMGVVSDNPSSSGYISASPGHLLFLPRRQFSDMANRHPSLAKFAVNLANKREEAAQSSLSANDLAEIDDE